MQFRARALDAQQRLISFDFEAADDGAARAHLLSSGLALVNLQRVRRSLRSATTSFPLLLFAQELHALLSAGLSVIESLDVLIEKESQQEILSILSALDASLREGQRLSAAMARRPDIFPALFVGILQAAEGTSDLPIALARFIDYETRIASVRQKIVSASIYPLILVGVGGGVAAFLMGYVVPRFAAVYRSGGRSLPWASRLLLDWGSFVGDHAFTLSLAAAVLIAIIGWRAMLHQRNGTWWRVLSVIPGARPKIDILELSRLYLTLGMLLQGGLHIMASLELASSAVPVGRREALARSASLIAEGEPLSAAFASTGLTTPVALRLLRVGERAGQMGEMFIRSADFHETETARWIERFTKAFEPVLMAGIGLAIGLIVLLLYMPIFDLAGSLQ